VPNVKFLGSLVPHILGSIAKFQKCDTRPLYDPIWSNFVFFLRQYSLPIPKVGRVSVKWPFWHTLAIFVITHCYLLLCHIWRFIRSTVRLGDIRRPKIPKVSHLTPDDTFRPNFTFFALVFTAIHICAKCEISSFNCPPYITGSQNSKSGSHEPQMTLLDLICIFR